MNTQYNLLTIVADSCRYDSFTRAHTNNIDRYFDVINAQAQATFTLPAHSAIFQGFYPSAVVDRPLYNRFVMSAVRWHYVLPRPSLITLVKGGSTIPEAFSHNGYTTTCIGGVGWFSEGSVLSHGFQHFEHIKDARKAVLRMIGALTSEPFYALLNCGTTHRPYQCPDTPKDLEKVNSPKSGTGYKSEYDSALHAKQVVAMSWLDKILGPLFYYVLKMKYPTIVCFCADHGDCFGEDGCYGHAFYHPNIMSVPLGWSMFKSGEGYPIDASVLRASS